MSIIRWEPLRELGSLQNEVNRLFNAMADAPANGGAAGGRWIPAMDLVERDDHFVLRADLPGMKEEDLSIEFEDNVLTLSGERKAEHEERQGNFRRVERSFGAFSRSLTLPKGVDPEAITAEFEDGVLRVTIPKPEERKPRRINIGTGDQKTIEGTETASAQGSASGEPAGAARQS